MQTMSTMISEVYDALKEAGASEDKARKAAEAIASYEDRFRHIEEQLTLVEERLTMLQWMIGFNLAMTVAILWKIFGG